MAKQTPRAYPPEFRHKVLELVRSGRSVAEVSRQFNVTRQTINEYWRFYDGWFARRPHNRRARRRSGLGRSRLRSVARKLHGHLRRHRYVGLR